MLERRGPPTRDAHGRRDGSRVSFPAACRWAFAAFWSR
jgi:hypothetical protein